MEISATITGKAAHAGVAPEEGISAILVAADAVTNMQLYVLTKKQPQTSEPFLLKAPIILCRKPYVFRQKFAALILKKLRGQCNQIIRSLQNACQKYSAALQYAIETTYDSYHIPENDPLILLLRDCCKIWISRYRSVLPAEEATLIFSMPMEFIRW